MALVFNTSFDSLQNKAKKLLNEVGFSTESGSVAKLFMSIVNSEISDFYTLLDEKILLSFLSTSSGNYLDKIGYLLNCIRNTGENDEDYKDRISKHILIVESSNEYCILSTAKNIEGVNNVYLKNYIYGPGSFAVIVSSSDEYNISENVLQNVYNALNEVVAYGTKYIVSAPINKYISMTINLSFKNNIGDILINEIKTKVKTEVSKYINSLSLSNNFIPSKFISTVMSVSEYITNMSCSEFMIDNELVDFVEQKAICNERFLISPEQNSIKIN